VSKFVKERSGVEEDVRKDMEGWAPNWLFGRWPTSTESSLERVNWPPPADELEADVEDTVESEDDGVYLCLLGDKD
jgi:hypothetical protein